MPHENSRTTHYQNTGRLQQVRAGERYTIEILSILEAKDVRSIDFRIHETRKSSPLQAGEVEESS